tara:strand:+ start:18868 stop:19359 length:492 start_codon:yes stop_codon:yes gene_type:complete
MKVKIKKVDAIRDFIKANHPTRKEIVKFLIVNLGGMCEKDFDYANHKGHYSTNFADWRRLGHITTDKKNRYSLTPLGKITKVSFYTEIPQADKDECQRRLELTIGYWIKKAKRHEKDMLHWAEQYNQSQKEVFQKDEEVWKLESELEKIKNTLGEFNKLLINL